MGTVAGAHTNGSVNTNGSGEDLGLLHQRVGRTDGPAKVTGTLRYAWDEQLPGMLWGRIPAESLPARPNHPD